MSNQKHPNCVTNMVGVDVIVCDYKIVFHFNNSLDSDTYHKCHIENCDGYLIVRDENYIMLASYPKGIWLKVVKV